jgi:hypothetical protein
MSLDDLIQTLTKRLATLSQMKAHAEATGNMTTLVNVEQEIADTELAIEKLKK